MDRKMTRIMNATLALMMTSTSVYAGALNYRLAPTHSPIILAQAECDPAADPNCAPSEQPQAEPAQEAPAAEQPAAEAPAEQPMPEPEPPAVEQPVEEAAPAPEPPAAEQAAEQQPTVEPAPEPEAPPAVEQPAEPAPEAPAVEQPAAEAPAETAPEPEPPAVEQPAEPAPEPQAAEQPAKQVEQPVPTEEAPAAEQPAPPAEPVVTPTGDLPAEPAPNDGAKAPLFDSQKRQPEAGQATGEQAPVDGSQQAAQPPAEPAVPPPADDKAAQADAQPVEIVPVTQEQGARRREGENNRPPETRPADATVVRELGNRIILQINNNVFVQSDERPRMGRGAREVYYEDLPRGRTRETIVRENGVQVVTIRNRYGDVIQRSRITPDGREYILTYVDEDNFERDRNRPWRDPGDDLPPMNVDIGYDDYIFEAERARGVDDYYNFLREPPVEKVRRLYSVDEVKRSARVRDIARRIDLDTIKFAFGKADVPESEIPRLEGVAQAIEKLLEANPAETFLIEGHTDAVGTNVANLALSDRRAEAVADALTNVFGIPPENLSTQGYGEQYLKVRTQEPNQENRRVAIRRITPLVAPIASAN